MAKITYLGCPGHFICAKECMFRLHTQVGDKYRVSTVGEYWRGDKMRPIGSLPGENYETLVFETLAEPVPNSGGCGCKRVRDWSPIQVIYAETAGQAWANHNATVAKHAAIVDEESSK